MKRLIEKEINSGYTDGTSCGFEFLSYDSKNWRCIKCKVEVRTNANLQLEDLNHYIRDFQLSFSNLLNKLFVLGILVRLKFNLHQDKGKFFLIKSSSRMMMMMMMMKVFMKIC